LPANCADCDKEPAQKDYWQCEGESESPVWTDNLSGDLYHVCPLRLISNSVNAWYSEYAFYQRYPGSIPKYSIIPAVFLDASSEYEAHFARYRQASEGKTVRQ
jgi:hypothetical protein